MGWGEGCRREGLKEFRGGRGWEEKAECGWKMMLKWGREKRK